MELLSEPKAKFRVKNGDLKPQLSEQEIEILAHDFAKKFKEAAKRAETRKKKREWREYLKSLDVEKFTEDEAVEIKDIAGAKSEVTYFLRKLRYEVESDDQYIVARHKDFPDTIFIKLAEHNSYQQYDKMKSIILTLRRFRSLIIKHLLGLLEQIDSSKLREDVITAFGWHANESDEIRHRALDDASVAWGEQHISKLLKLLLNEWRNHPTNDVYVHMVKDDYDWFDETHIKDSIYTVQKKQLLRELRSECENVLPRASPSFKRILRRVDDIDSWFIVIY